MSWSYCIIGISSDSANQCNLGNCASRNSGSNIVLLPVDARFTCNNGRCSQTGAGARLAQLLAVEEEEERRHDGDDKIPVHPHIALLPHVWYPVPMAPILL